MYPESSSKSKTAPSKDHQNSDLAAPVRQIVGLVVFDGEKFLLLHRVLHWKGWEFPKGHIMEGESIEAATGRELLEETGIPKYELIGKIDELDYYDPIKKRSSNIKNFLVRVSSNNKINFENQPLKDGKMAVEHDDFKWCFPAEAVKTLRHKNMKRTMLKAIKMLGLEMTK
jgi:8-oxo-dGTP pyrophosphatase MutT (NUDIX family)